MKKVKNMELKQVIQEDMKGVTETSKMIRDFFLDPNKTNDEKLQYIKPYSMALSANKTVVTASIVKINCEKM